MESSFISSAMSSRKSSLRRSGPAEQTVDDDIDKMFALFSKANADEHAAEVSQEISIAIMKDLKKLIEEIDSTDWMFAKDIPRNYTK